MLNCTLKHQQQQRSTTIIRKRKQHRESAATVDHLKRRFCPLVYLVTLPTYTFIGAVVFHYCESGMATDRIKQRIDNCTHNYEHLIATMTAILLNSSSSAQWQCQSTIDSAAQESTIQSLQLQIRQYLLHTEFEICSRYEQLNTKNSLADFSQSVILAISIYTTIGFGYHVPITQIGQLFTILYAIVGIPLFLAFTADYGILLSDLLNCTVKATLRFIKNRRVVANHDEADGEIKNVVHFRAAKHSEQQVIIQLTQLQSFVIVVFVLIIYFAVVSIFTYWLERPDWTLLESLYYTFTTVTLIGFGDYEANDTAVYIFVICPLILFGTTMVAMAYFFIQETIRAKTAKAAHLIYRRSYQRRRTSVVSNDRRPSCSVCGSDFDDSIVITDVDIHHLEAFDEDQEEVQITSASCIGTCSSNQSVPYNLDASQLRCH